MTEAVVLPRAPRARPEQSLAAGFTFLEILVVMAVAAVLLGLGIGFIGNVGKTTLTQQAAAILAESGQRCLNMSAGARRATLVIRRVKTESGGDRLQVQTAVQRTVLTSNFEVAPNDRPDLEWFVYANGPDSAKPVGKVRLEPAGLEGGAVSLEGGYVDFGSRSTFAMTDGFELDAWVMPSTAGRGNMTLMRSDGDGQVLWSIRLVKDAGGPEAYRVLVRVTTVPADAVAGATAVGGRDFQTKSAPVLPGVWNHVSVSYDGQDAAILVNGVNRYEPERVARPASAAAEALAAVGQRMLVPPGGVAHLTLSAADSAFIGLVDTLNVSGIFRTDEDVRLLPLGVDVIREVLPVRLVFSNGRLDPTVHNRDREIRLQGPADQESGGWQVVRFGLYGSIPPPYRFDPAFNAGPAMGEGPP